MSTPDWFKPYAEELQRMALSVVGEHSTEKDNDSVVLTWRAGSTGSPDTSRFSATTGEWTQVRQSLKSNFGSFPSPGITDTWHLGRLVERFIDSTEVIEAAIRWSAEASGTPVSMEMIRDSTVRCRRILYADYSITAFEVFSYHQDDEPRDLSFLIDDGLLLFPRSLCADGYFDAQKSPFPGLLVASDQT